MKQNTSEKKKSARQSPGKPMRDIQKRRRKAAEKHRINRKERKKEIKLRKQEAERAVVYQLYRTIMHFFPDIFEYMREIEDYRKKSEYTLTEIITACIAMFVFTAGSRNEFNNMREEGKFKKNYKKLFKLAIPHPDTVDNVMRQLPEDMLEKLKEQLVKVLIEKKSLHKYRFQDKYFIIAIDGTGVVSFERQHCPQCLHRTSKKDKTTWFHNVLEAKLITPGGFSISVATVWIENPEDGNYEKQDCERKAFKRLSEKLKKQFPRLPICLTADGLYPYEGFFDICRGYGWKYIVTLKDGSLPSVQEERRELGVLMPTNRRENCTVEKGKRIKREYSWVTGIDYKTHIINCIEYVETVFTEEKQNQIKFVHVTDIEVSFGTVIGLSKTGCLRWKIENEGFNIQKNNGYNLQHKYSRVNYRAMKNYYQCLQIGHMINQLLILSTDFQEQLKGKMTVIHLWKRLIGVLTWLKIDKEQLACIDKEKRQIRFVT